jgi:DMSO/TMAO reductase YedYZ molybdopterin-dependent catalytic subunit
LSNEKSVLLYARTTSVATQTDIRYIELPGMNNMKAGENMEDHALTRRRFFQMAAALTTIGVPSLTTIALGQNGHVNLPFTRGERELATFPEKAPLILLRTRPPLLETPFQVFDEGVFTPNDKFYVRWHEQGIPTSVDTSQFRLKIVGQVQKPVTLTLDDLVRRFSPIEYAAVNQCSGNSRGFMQPRVPGGQWGNGAMGNAVWTGVPVKTLLAAAGIKPDAIQVRFHGLDNGNPRFMKSLMIHHAMDGEVMVAYAMNHAATPVLNGYPVRLVVPGWYSTYWVKALDHIEVLNHADENFWMATAYRIPDTPHADMKPGQKGVRMIPINRMVPRSFFTNLRDGDRVPAGKIVRVRGIAFGGDSALKQVLFSTDGGEQWQPAELGKDYGKYSFRRWNASFNPTGRREHTLAVKAVNVEGASQAVEPIWNPGGYMRSAIEQIKIYAA